jgi:hypothetical protein
MIELWRGGTAGRLAAAFCWYVQYDVQCICSSRETRVCPMDLCNKRDMGRVEENVVEDGLAHPVMAKKLLLPAGATVADMFIFLCSLSTVW